MEACTKEQEKRARLLFNLVDSIGRSEMLEYDFRLQKKVERGPNGGGAKRTLRKSRRKPRKTTNSRTNKCIKRKTA